MSVLSSRCCASVGPTKFAMWEWISNWLPVLGCAADGTSGCGASSVWQLHVVTGKENFVNKSVSLDVMYSPDGCVSNMIWSGPTYACDVGQDNNNLSGVTNWQSIPEGNHGRKLDYISPAVDISHIEIKEDIRPEVFDFWHAAKEC